MVRSPTFSAAASAFSFFFCCCNVICSLLAGLVCEEFIESVHVIF